MPAKYIGIDGGATNIRVAVADSKFRILKKSSQKSLYHKGEAVINQIIQMIESLGVDETDVDGIGIGFAGAFNSDGFLHHPTLKTKIKISEPLEEKFGVKPDIINDCDAAVIAEKILGAGKKIDDLTYVTISTGIGCGVIANGKLVMGHDNSATELGHTVVDINGQLYCGCGIPGHWEGYCSGNGIPKFARFLAPKFGLDPHAKFYARLANDEVGSGEIFEMANAGDKFCSRVVDEVGRINGIAIGNIIEIFNPELITIGGTVVLKNPNVVLDPIRKYAPQYSLNKVPRIEVTKMGDDIGLIGAVLVGAEKHKDFL